MVNFIIHSGPKNQQWVLTCMYGSCYEAERINQWQIIADMGQHMDLPWVIIGDLNVTLSSYERQSFTTHTTPTPRIVQEIVSRYGLQDIPCSGHPFTWSNRRQQFQFVQTRLDRALASVEWFSLFPDVILRNLIPMGSDHAPILLTTSPQLSKCYKRFRLYETWTKPGTFKDLITKTWRYTPDGSPAAKFTKKLNKARQDIRIWKRITFDNVDERIHHIQQQIHEAQQSTIISQEDVFKLQSDLQHWYQFKADIAFQQSRERILQNQDKNTKCFHTKANFRRRRNQIDSIRDDKGNWYNSREEIQQLLLNHFINITTSTNPSQESENFQLIHPCITQAENDALTRIPSREEIWEVVCQINFLGFSGT